MYKQQFSPRVGVAALSSPLEVGADQAPRAVQELSGQMASAGHDVVNAGCIDNESSTVSAGQRLAEAHVDAVVFVVTSWFEDYLVLDLLEECRRPCLFRPLPGMETGALCGVQQVTAYLTQLDVPFHSVFGAMDDPECVAESDVFLKAAALGGRLRRCRVGMAGHQVNGMTHTSPNEFLLKKNIGPRILHLDLPRILKSAEEVSEAEVTVLWKEVRDRAGVCDVDDVTGIDSLRLYAVFREIVEKHGLDALAAGCYPHLMGRVCLAVSLLADEGVPLACEGDVHGAVGMFMLQLLTGGPVHNTDWLNPVDENSVVFSHCGSGSFSLAENPGRITLGSVRLMGQGVCAMFPARTGPVTLVNITPHVAGYQCAVLEGEAEPTEMVFPGNPARVRFRSPVRDLIDWIHETGLGHHWMIGYGQVAEPVRAWSRIAGAGIVLQEP